MLTTIKDDFTTMVLPMGIQLMLIFVEILTSTARIKKLQDSKAIGDYNEIIDLYKVVAEYELVMTYPRKLEDF